MSSDGTIATHFGDLTDGRDKQGQRHTLGDVITIAICAIIAGGEGWTDMELYGRTKETWFRSFLELAHGIPSDDTFRRVFEAIDPEKFQGCFMSWVEAINKLTSGQVVAIDGKTVKGTRGKGQRAIHMVSAFASVSDQSGVRFPHIL